MIDFGILSEIDLALIAVLQAEPRASWATVSRVTGLSPATAARHWERLAASGVVWVTASPGEAVWSAHCVAYVEVTCTAGATLEVAHTLAQDPHALTVEVTAGSADLFLTVAAVDLSTMSNYLLRRVDTVAGITHTNTRISTKLYKDGSHWRLDARPRRRSAPPSAGLVTRPGRESAAQHADLDRKLSLLLGMDGRASYADLSHQLEVSEATVRRRVDQLLRSGAVILRTEVSAERVGWPVSAIMSLDVPVTLLGEAARTATRLRQVRLVATVAGRPSLIVVAWLKYLEEIHELEGQLVDTVPQLQVQNRLTVLHTVKRMGRILDEHGDATGVVPMSHWQNPFESADLAPA
ncbi:Lrp/AsnC family transcriptional regulator [Flexivirga alba]|uniref:Lrp/AsnC family transcriptional regulator n=1 Tax=Flexivirga alba TaxID=702742 RepID=A0ABW2AJP9_9MICO